MAEITTKINLIDNMSPALKGMHKALNVLLNTFEAVAAKTKTPIDVKAVQTARNELARVGVMLDKVGTDAIQTAQATQNIAAATNKVTQAANEVSKTWNLTQHQIARIDKITTEMAISEDNRAKKLEEIAKLRAAEEVDQNKIKRLELEIDNLLAGEELKRQNIWKIIDDSAKAAGKLTSESVRQEILANRLAASKVRLANVEASGAERLRKAEELTNNARLQGENIKKRGVNLELQAENIKKRGVALDEAAANRAERKVKATEKNIQKLAQEYAIHKSIEATQQRFAGGVAKVTQKYEEAKQKVRALEQSADRYTQAGKIELKTAREICNLREKIYNATNKLVETRVKLNTLEIQGKNLSLQALIAKRQERSIKEQIAKSSSKVLNLERQLPGLINQAKAAQDRHNSSIRQGVSNTNALWSKMKGLAGAYLGIQTVGGVIKTADALAANEARLNLMVKEGETVKQVNDQIYAAAMRSRSSFLGMADAVAKVGIQAGNLFSNSSDMVRFMETFNKMAVISKSTTQQTNAAMTQLIQALSFGQLRGDELKSILENMPMVAQVLADELTRMGDGFFNTLPDKLKHIAADGKVTADEIRALGYEGQIASETVVNAMLNGSKKIDKMAKNMTWTWGQVWEVFKNAALKAFTPIFNGISKIIQTDRFKRFATWVDNAMSRVANAINGLWETAGPVIAKIFDGIAAIGNFISNNWSFIAPVIWGIVGALTAMKIASMAAAIWSGILTAAKVVGAFVTWAFTKATVAQAGAQWGLNAAMYACPLTWIIMAIIAVIVVIYLAVAAINHFAGTSYSATGFIAGLFMTLYASIYNNVAMLWNTFASFAEFLVNVFKHPAYATKKLFVDLAVNIIDCLIAMTKGCDDFATSFVNAMYEAINWVLDGWNWMVDKLGIVGEKMGLGKATKLEMSTSITSDLSNAKADLESSVKDMPDDYWVAPRMEFKNPVEYYNKGYNWGKGVADKFDGLMSGASLEELKNLGDLDKKLKQGDFSKALEGGYDDPKTANGASGVGKNPALDKIADDTGKIADSSGQTAENTSQNDEYFKYLRRAGERHSMNRQQLLNFKVDMSNVNHIKSGLDYDEMMKRLARELYQQVVSKMNGAVAH